MYTRLISILSVRSMLVVSAALTAMSAQVSSASPTINIANTSHHDAAPQIACAKPYTEDRPCLVVHEYAYSGTDTDLYAQRISVAGTITTGKSVVADRYAIEKNVAIASMWDHETYITAWEEDGANGSTDVKLQLLDLDGVPTTAPIAFDSTADERHPTLACGHNECLLVWTSDTPNEATKLLAQRIDTSGTVLGSAFIVHEGKSSTPSVDAFGAEGPDVFVVAWQEEVSPEDNDILGAMVLGSSSGAVFTIESSSRDEMRPQIACRFGQGCMVVNEYQYAPGDRDIHGHLLGGIPYQPTLAAMPTVTTTVLAYTYEDERTPAIDRDAVFDHRYTVAWDHEIVDGANPSEIMVGRYAHHDLSWEGGGSMSPTFAVDTPRRVALAGSEWDDYLITWDEQTIGLSLEVVALPIAF